MCPQLITPEQMDNQNILISGWSNTSDSMSMSVKIIGVLIFQWRSLHITCGLIR